MRTVGGEGGNAERLGTPHEDSEMLAETASAPLATRGFTRRIQAITSTRRTKRAAPAVDPVRDVIEPTSSRL